MYTTAQYAALARLLHSDSPVYPFPATVPTLVVSRFGDDLEIANNGDAYTVSVELFGSAIIDELNAEFADDEAMDELVSAALADLFSHYSL